MANVKISAMSAAGALDGTEVVAGVQSGGNVKITTAAIGALSNLIITGGTVTVDPTTTIQFESGVNTAVTVADFTEGVAAVQYAVTVPGNTEHQVLATDGDGTLEVAPMFFSDDGALSIDGHAASPFITADAASVTTTGVGVGTLTNAPHAANPDVFINISVNGTIYGIPAWTLP